AEQQMSPLRCDPFGLSLMQNTAPFLPRSVKHAHITPSRRVGCYSSNTCRSGGQLSSDRGLQGAHAGARTREYERARVVSEVLPLAVRRGGLGWETCIVPK